MTLNAGQYLAPLNSGQVLSGYAQGVIEGIGVSIAPDGTISLDTAGAATLGFLVSSSAPAPVYNWSTIAGGVNSILTNDGTGNVYWTTNYVTTFPVGDPFPHTGAAGIPAGTTASRPASLPGLLRYNTDFLRLEFNNGTNYLPVSPATGGVFSFVSSAAPTPNAPGDIWLDTNTNQAKVWTGVTWIPTTPLATTLIPGRVIIGANVQVAVDGTISILTTTGVPGAVSNLGVTTITDNTSSSGSYDSALSANMGYQLQQQINALIISNNLTFAGLVNGSGILTYVSPEGSGVGFTLGNPLPFPNPGNNEYFVICEQAGGFTPPGGSYTVTTQGDWFLSNGASWIFLNVGYDPPYATTTSPGIVRLSTTLETQTGTDNTVAVTPFSLSSRTATEIRTGIAEISSQAEADAGLDDTTIVSPLKLHNVFSSGAIDANDILLNPVINGNANTQSALNDAIYNVSSGDSSLGVTINATGLVVLTAVQATEVQIGMAEVASQIETDAGTSDTKMLTPLKLDQYVAGGQIDATEIVVSPPINGGTTVNQVLLNAVYNVASSNGSVTISESGVGQVDLSITQATEAQLGGAQIATQAEANALTNDLTIITPLKLGAVFSSGSVDAADILLNPTINGTTTVEQALLDAIYNVTSTDSSITIAITAVGQAAITVTQATETQLGGAEIATQAETDAGLSDSVLITPQKLAGYVASGQIEASEVVVNPAINGNINVQTALTNAIYNVASSNSSVAVVETAVGQVDVTINQATTTLLGGAELATTAEALAGLNTTNIITPDTLRSAAVFKSDFNAKGDLLSASGNDIPVILPVGTDGQFLVANSVQSSGLEWQTLQASYIVVSPAINGLTNVQAVLTDAVYNIASSDNSIVVVETLTGQVDVTVRQATESQIGGGEIATQAETDAGLSDSVLITPQKLAGYIASGQIDASEVIVSPAINGNTDVQAALTDAVYNITSTGNTLGVTSAATGLFNLDVVQATTAQLGGAELATTAEALAGLNTTNIITPDTLRSAAVFKSDFNAKGDLLSASGNDIPVILSIGVDGQILVANSLQTSGLEWQTLSASNIIVTPAINGLTNLNTILNDAVYNIASSDNSIVISQALTGQVDATVIQATETQLGGAQVATQVETETGLLDTLVVTPLKLRTAAVYKSDFNAKGDILSAASNDSPLILPVGTTGQYLVVDPLAATGLKWYTIPNTTGVAGFVSNLGLTTITDNLTSVGSLDSALSANMGYALQQQIDALVISNNLTLAGTIDSLGVLVFVTTEGIAAGFVLGATLPVSSALNAEYYVICEQAGTITPPGGVATVVTQGDWFLSTGTGYQLLDVGYNAPNATTAIPGIVRLSTNAETQAGLNATIAVTPASLESRQATETLTGLIEIATQAEANTGTDDVRAVTPLKMRTSTVYQSDFNAKGDVLSASANDTPLILSVGADGALLVADSTTPTGLKWAVQAAPGAPYFETLDDVSGGFNGVTTSFGLTIASVAYTPSPASNIMVFLGGIAQTPGASNAYTIAGSNISFVNAPPTGTTFYATTVLN
jgi:hypothetical protein